MTPDKDRKEERKAAMTTFRACYIPADPESNGVGVRLTGEEHANLSDAELFAEARAELHRLGESPYVTLFIGDWTE
jgi:hypothetical protein